MDSDIKYRIFNDSLIFESCPSVLTKEMLDEVCVYNYKKIVLCEGVEEIGDRAFIDCSALENIELPSSLKRIGKEAFRECCELREIAIPENVREISDLCFYKCHCLENVSLPNNLLSIGNKAFENSQLIIIMIPDSVLSIGNEAFSGCYRLRSIYFSRNLERIGKKAFYRCVNLRGAKLYDNLSYIGESAFEFCCGLNFINIPKNVKEIKNKTFYNCNELKCVEFPSELKIIGKSAFENCFAIKTLPKLDCLEILEDAAFYNCERLNSVEFGDNLREIGARAFAYCPYLTEVTIPNSVHKLGNEAFYHCINLKDVVLSSSISVINKGTFDSCRFLSRIAIPDSVVEIESAAFKSCDIRLKSIRLPNNLKKIGNHSFSDCSELKEVTIPEGVVSIPDELFSFCNNLEVINFPSSIETFKSSCVRYCNNLKKVTLNTKNGMKCFDFQCVYLLDNIDEKFMVYDSTRSIYIFYMNGECIEFSKDIFRGKPFIERMLENKLIASEDLIRLYYWNKRKFIPSQIVIKNMPLNDIDKFYINDNGKEWSKLVSSAGNIFSDEGRESFFKLCYVLGLFSESTAIRDRAIKFLNDKIVNVIDGDYIHSKFDGFDLSNGFNEEYAEFFIKYYNDYDFMIMKDEYGDEIDLMAASYNNFKNVKKVYPGKTLHTNRKADVLLPIHVMNAVRNTIYGNVNDGNEDFAFVVGKYGYTQEQFEQLQSFYNIGKNIVDKDLKLFIKKDLEDKGITYELLNKSNPLNAVLGNITNCCQVLGAAGESCLEYGMTKANSGFIVFSYKGKIIGQSWVWYDEDSKTVCLDNIEIPHIYSDKIKDSKILQKSFIECLIRVKENFVSEMNKNGFEVKNVTVGKGFNDIQYVLDKYFSLVEFSDMLTDYSGYSDAKEQYDIKIIKNNINQGR